jgi:hypothetical protein
MKPAWIQGALVGVLGGAGLSFAVLRLVDDPGAPPRSPPAADAAAPAPPAPSAPALAEENMRRSREALREEVRSLRDRLRATDEARLSGANPAAAENTILRAEVERLRARLQTEKLVRREHEGKPFEFPPDLPDRYRQDALMKTFTEAMRRAGVAGEVQSIDCNEFPCIVYGNLEAKGRSDTEAKFRALNDELRKQHPAESDQMTTSLWTSRDKKEGAEKQRSMFGFSVFPNDPKYAKDSELRRRLRHRQSQYVEAAGNP